MKKIIILDYCNAKVFIKDYDNEKWELSEEFLTAHGFKEDDCHWMIVNEVKIEID